MTATPSGDRPAPHGARIAYGVLYVVVLPALMAAWALRLDALLTLPAVDLPAIGLAATAAGLALMVAGTLVLWTSGRGLPMSPFPPERLVTDGVYRLTTDPIYVGAVLLTLGVSLSVRSAAGLWIVTPVLVLACASFVIGYERDATRQRFGGVVTPLLRIPPATDERPTTWDVAAVYLLVLLPWVVAYEGLARLGSTRGAWDSWTALDARIPLVPWTEAAYFAAYPLVLLAPWAARRRGDLRRFALRGLGATVAIALFWLLVPIVAPAKDVGGDGLWAMLMRWERTSDQRVTALPAFHVVWPCIAASLLSSTWPRWRALWWTLVLAIAVSCGTTGMHSVADILGGLVAFAIVVNGSAIWRRICDASEWVANSWGEATLGPVRFLSHGMYTGLGATIGLLVAVHLAGADALGWLTAIAATAIVGAGLWAQFVEGSPQLLRPFGYFGGAFAALAACAVAVLAGADGWRLFAAFAVGGAFAQAIGRVRCLVQGCCHGRPAPAALGIRYTHPRSRVVRLSTLGGVPIHPTPLYSLVWTLLVGCVLWRCWSLGAPLPFIGGGYYLLVGLGRFAEEHYRGEPQTAVFFGLRLYQWLAIGFVVFGAAMMAAGAHAAPTPSPLTLHAILTAAALGVFAYAAFGVDFPNANRRFSRLV
jgi:protein-S-isoprenylcysteine O-methyltransferase Ste14